MILEHPLKDKVNFFWFRRDLRLEDNSGLYHALSESLPVVPVFIFDTNILDKLEDKDDARVTFIHGEVERLHQEFIKLESSFVVKHGDPIEVWKQLLKEYNVATVFANEDYEPYAIKRDSELKELFDKNDTSFHLAKDHVIFAKEDVLKKDGTPYTVYTPYSRKWKEAFDTILLDPYPSESITNWIKSTPRNILSLREMGFSPSEIQIPDRDPNIELIKKYDQTRDIPSITGTSRLSVHLRFGTISIRKIMQVGRLYNEKYWNELIWREFYSAILWHFPQTVKENFNRKYDAIQWLNDEGQFKNWCEGKTGYPIVDAGMRELNVTGFMHNRVRMIVSSFLTKHLLIDWRWGEAYFARKLLDYEQASNIGGWQWAAGTGVDAAPYFRVFNPTAQMEKFDSELKYVRKWVPEFGTEDYSEPIVDQKYARNRAIETYKNALNSI